MEISCSKVIVMRREGDLGGISIANLGATFSTKCCRISVVKGELYNNFSFFFNILFFIGCKLQWQPYWFNSSYFKIWGLHLILDVILFNPVVIIGLLKSIKSLFFIFSEVQDSISSYLCEMVVFFFNGWVFWFRCNWSHTQTASEKYMG